MMNHTIASSPGSAPAPLDGMGAQAESSLETRRYLELFKSLTPLMGSHNRQDICRQACALIAQLLGVEACSIMLTAAKRQTLRLMAATHIPSEEWPGIEQPVGAGICGAVFQSEKVIQIRDRAQFLAQFGRDPDGRSRSPWCTVVPLHVQGRVDGVINVSHPASRRIMRQPDIDLLTAAAGFIGGALTSAVQYEESCQIYRNLVDVFDSLHVGILSVNHDGIVTQSNERARDLFGLATPGAAPLSLDEALPAQLYHVSRQLVRQAAREHEPMQERLRVTLPLPEGPREVLLEVTASRMRCMGGMVSDSLLIFEDVGQDEEVQRLREAEHMKRNFLNIISHELRTPLAVLRGALPLIDPAQDREIERETLAQAHRLMLKNCHRLTDVVGSILDVTEIEGGTLRLVRRPVNLHLMLDEAITLHAENASHKQLAWDCRFMASRAELSADKRRLRQVLAEMVANAIKFSNPGGTISIHTRDCEPWIEVEITNTGARIEPSLRKNVFEKFFQGDQDSATRTAGGCGLGLFLVSNIVRLHDGQVELVDREDDVTTFIVRLPAGQALPAEKLALAQPVFPCK